MGNSASVQRIIDLEKVTSVLEPDTAQRSFLGGAALDYAEKFLEGLPDAPSFYLNENSRSGLYQFPITDQPRSLEDVLNILGDHVDSQGTNTPSAGYMGYIPGGPIFHSALGDFLAAISNRYAGHFYGSPGAVRMENMLLKWMSEIVGYPSEAAGNLTSGGSLANLIAIVTAREAYQLMPANYQKIVVYLTEQAHHSVNKGLYIAGLSEVVHRMIPTDQNYRMDAGELESAISQDERQGLKPWLVIASAGTTNTGSVDPLGKIGEIAKHHQLWYHVDGAYGGFFNLCEPGRKILHGIHASDSLTLDPHKGLFLPFGTGAILVKDAQQLINAFSFQAAYAQDAVEHTQELSPSDLSPELTKHFRGLRLWLPLMLVGTRPFESALEEKLLLARYFYDRLQAVEGFELGPAPDLSIVTFRYLPKHGSENDFNRRLIQAIQDDGRIFLSSTNLNGKFVIRLAVLGIRTHLDTIDQAIEILQETVKTVLNT
jgi:aromatic-L-amino-acid decarboxylase